MKRPGRPSARPGPLPVRAACNNRSYRRVNPVRLTPRTGPLAHPVWLVAEWYRRPSLVPTTGSYGERIHVNIVAAAQPTDPAEVAAIITGLVDNWRPRQDTESVFGQRDRPPDEGRFVAVYGLAAHVHRLGETFLDLYERALDPEREARRGRCTRCDQPLPSWQSGGFHTDGC